jgi:hypothetical protein
MIRVVSYSLLALLVAVNQLFLWRACSVRVMADASWFQLGATRTKSRREGGEAKQHLGSHSASIHQIDNQSSWKL